MTYDALLLLGFGGPEGPDEVIPFLERVTAGRNVPRERLQVVGEHYFALGGVSPINAQNRALLGALTTALAEREVHLPFVLANRNSPPYVADVMAELATSGHRRVLALATSAYSSYSGCRQYREDLGCALAETEAALDVVKVSPFWHLPGLVEANIDLLAVALAAAGPAVHVLFTTHSLPTRMADGSGPEGKAYVGQHLAVARASIAGAAARARRDVPGWDLVFQSRSGPPHVPWLGPDVNDALRDLAAGKVGEVVLAPIGFITDHVEVIWDLDTEARATAAELGLRLTRVPTVGTHPAFLAALADLLAAHLSADRPPRPGEPCFGPCCPTPAQPKPVVEGALL